MDLAVKWRLFNALSGGDDPDAERVYLWHIKLRSGDRMKADVATDKWKTSLDHYLAAAKELHASMISGGFDPRFPIPVDQDGEILDGSHRVACALSLGLPRVAVEFRNERVWAPAWDYVWFLKAGMATKDKIRLLDDWRAMCRLDLPKSKR